jgi:hypothetical protein
MHGARRGAFEGAFASRNPAATLPAPVPRGFTAGPAGAAMGRFGWADPATGLVSNVYTAGFLLGLVTLQRLIDNPAALWDFAYWQRTPGYPGSWYIRQGKMVTLANTGDFWVRFMAGSQVGLRIWADPATGYAYTADAGGFILTPWYAAINVQPGGLGVVTPWMFPNY